LSWKTKKTWAKRAEAKAAEAKAASGRTLRIVKTTIRIRVTCPNATVREQVVPKKTKPFVLRKFPGLVHCYRTTDGKFEISQEDTNCVDVGKGRWFLKAIGRGWENSDDSVIENASGFRTKPDAEKALEGVYKEHLAAYFMTGDLAEAGGCLHDFDYTETYLTRLLELPNVPKDKVEVIRERMRVYEIERQKLAQTKKRIHEVIDSLWSEVIHSHTLEALQEATGHDWDE
jgi:hypothetical protein